MSQEKLLPLLSDTWQKLWKYTGCLCCLGEWLSAVTGEGRRWFSAIVKKGRLGLVFTLPGKMVPWSFWGSRFFYFLPNFRCWGQDFSWRETKLCYRLVFASKGGQLERKTLFKIRLSSQKPLQEMPSERQCLQPCHIHKDNENTVLSVWRLLQKFLSKGISCGGR